MTRPVSIRPTPRPPPSPDGAFAHAGGHPRGGAVDLLDLVDVLLVGAAMVSVGVAEVDGAVGPDPGVIAVLEKPGDLVARAVRSALYEQVVHLLPSKPGAEEQVATVTAEVGVGVVLCVGGLERLDLRPVSRVLGLSRGLAGVRGPGHDALHLAGVDTGLVERLQGEIE